MNTQRILQIMFVPFLVFLLSVPFWIGKVFATPARGRFTEQCTALTTYNVCEVTDHYTKKRYIIAISSNGTVLKVDDEFVVP